MARCGSGCLHEKANCEMARRQRNLEDRRLPCDGNTGACTGRDGSSVENLQGPRA
jgi:hypothetical protein